MAYVKIEAVGQGLAKVQILNVDLDNSLQENKTIIMADVLDCLSNVDESYSQDFLVVLNEGYIENNFLVFDKRLEKIEENNKNVNVSFN